MALYWPLFFFKENQELNKWFYAGVALILLAVILQMYRVAVQKKH